MKKSTLLLFGILCLAHIVEAQIKKGSFLTGGSINAYKNSTDNQQTEITNTGIITTPSVGYAFRDNLVAGLTGSYGILKAKPEGLSEESFGAGVFIRKYISLGHSFYLFGQSDLGYQRGSMDYKSTDNTQHIRQKGARLNLFPGLAYGIHRNLHIEAGLNSLISLGYYHVKNENSNLAGSTLIESKSAYINANLSSASQVYIGFRVVLGK